MATAAANQIKARHLPALDDSARQLVLAAAHPVDHSLVEIIELVALSGEIGEGKRARWGSCGGNKQQSSLRREQSRESDVLAFSARAYCPGSRDVARDVRNRSAGGRRRQTGDL